MVSSECLKCVRHCAFNFQNNFYPSVFYDEWYSGTDTERDN